MAETNVDSRLSRLEAVVESLTISVASLEGSIEKYIGSSRTNWSTIFSGVGVLLIAVFAMNQAIVTPLERDVRHNSEKLTNFIEYRFNSFEENTTQHTYDLNTRVSKLEAYKEMEHEH